MDSLELLQDIRDSIHGLRTDIALHNQRFEQSQRDMDRAFDEIRVLKVTVAKLDKAEDKNGAARYAAWAGALALVGMFLISAYDSWKANLNEEAAVAVERHAKEIVKE